MGKTSQRIEYIDVLRGLCMVLIVWYHTNHPSLLDYPFYNSTLFFISGMIFKPMNFSGFINKKFWKLFVPFVLFYILYYLFLITINLAKYHSVSNEIYASILDVFRLYKDNDAYICNYPLWFLWALFWVQFAGNYMIQVIRRPLPLFFSSLIISVIGYVFVQHIPTPFILGRSFTFIVYYISGYLFNSLLINKCNNKNILFVSLVIWLLSLVLNKYTVIPIVSTILYCIELISTSIILLLFCKHITLKPFVQALSFIGINSLVVLGLHDMYLSFLRIITTNIYGEMSIALGCVNWMLTLVLMVPTIYILNKHFPLLVGKKT